MEILLLAGRHYLSGKGDVLFPLCVSIVLWGVGRELHAYQF